MDNNDDILRLVTDVPKDAGKVLPFRPKQTSKTSNTTYKMQVTPASREIIRWLWRDHRINASTICNLLLGLFSAICKSAATAGVGSDGDRVVTLLIKPNGAMLISDGNSSTDDFQLRAIRALARPGHEQRQTPRGK